MTSQTSKWPSAMYNVYRSAFLDFEESEGLVWNSEQTLDAERTLSL